MTALPEQISQMVIQHTKDIAALTENSKSAHKRIDENDRIIEGIHKLAANVEALTYQVKSLADKMDNHVSRLEAGQKSHGERIGNIEKALTVVDRHENYIKKHGEKIDKIEKEPAQKWKDLVKQITGLVIAAVVGAVIAGVIK